MDRPPRRSRELSVGAELPDPPEGARWGGGWGRISKFLASPEEKTLDKKGVGFVRVPCKVRALCDFIPLKQIKAALTHAAQPAEGTLCWIRVSARTRQGKGPGGSLERQVPRPISWDGPKKVPRSVRESLVPVSPQLPKERNSFIARGITAPSPQRKGNRKCPFGPTQSSTSNSSRDEARGLAPCGQSFGQSLASKAAGFLPVSF